MSSEEPEAAERVPSLVDVLRQLELPAVEALVDGLDPYYCVPNFRLTCRALRDLVDTSVLLPEPLAIRLREDGTATEPLAALLRWGRRDGIKLDIELPVEAPPDGVEALLPAAFTELSEQARRRVTEVSVSCSRDAAYHAPRPTVPGSAVGALASWLPCLRTLTLHGLAAGWSPVSAGEAYTALAALGTLEELELPGAPSLTGVEVLVGSLRRLKLVWRGSAHPALTLPAAAPLGQLTRLQVLELLGPDMDLGAGPLLRTSLGLLPPSANTLRLCLAQTVGTFGVAGGRLRSADLDRLRFPELAALARDELLPCLGPEGRLESVRVNTLDADGWGTADVAPILELWRRSNEARVGELAVKGRQSSADTCSAMERVGPVERLYLRGRPSIRFSLQPQRLPESRDSLLSPASCVEGSRPLDLPPPEEVLRMALQRIAPPGVGGEAGAAGGRQETAADAAKLAGRVLLLRGPVTAAALEQPSSEALRAWAQDLEDRAQVAAGPDFGCGGPLVVGVLQLPPASAVLLQCSKLNGAAGAVAAAVTAAGEGSGVAQSQAPEPVFDFSSLLDNVLCWGLEKVMGELWAASYAGEGGPSLQQRVEWAIDVREMVDSLPRSVYLSD